MMQAEIPAIKRDTNHSEVWPIPKRATRHHRRDKSSEALL